jgi:hypothetical protein
VKGLAVAATKLPKSGKIKDIYSDMRSNNGSRAFYVTKDKQKYEKFIENHDKENYKYNPMVDVVYLDPSGSYESAIETDRMPIPENRTWADKKAEYKIRNKTKISYMY